jgi:hypothetical protein
MKCIVCSTEIDETATFPDVDIGGQKVPDTINRVRHAQTLEKWEQVVVSINRQGASVQILAGHVCPADRLDADNVQITKGGK